MMNKIYPRKGDTQTVYLNAVVKDPSIEIGDYTIFTMILFQTRVCLSKTTYCIIIPLTMNG